MNINLFKDAKFNFAWEMPLKISLFGKEYEILISADAYYSTDKVTIEQNESCKKFIENYSDIIRNIEEILIKESGTKENALKSFNPIKLKIKRNGNCGIVFDDRDDFENGFVITIIPTYDLVSTDEYF